MSIIMLSAKVFGAVSASKLPSQGGRLPQIRLWKSFHDGYHALFVQNLHGLSSKPCGVVCNQPSALRHLSSTAKMSECYKCHQPGHFARECTNDSIADSINGFSHAPSYAPFYGGTGGSYSGGSVNGGDRGGGGLECYNCSQPGHFARECPEPRRASKDTRQCNNCQQVGHISRYCLKRP